MRTIINLLLTVVISIITIFCANAQSSKSQKLIVIDGHFFNEMPISKQSIAKMHMLQTPNGTMALGLELSIELSEEALKHALPLEQVPEADVLRQRYNEAKSASSSLNVVIAKKSMLKVGDKFPDFTATDINGKQWTQEDIKGKVMVLNLWFSGCGPCRSEMPELSTWKNEMPDVMFFSATYESAEIARPIIEKQGFNWIHLIDNNQFKEFVGNNGYPMTIIVDKAGVVAMIEFGTSPTQRTKLKEEIKKHIE